MNPDTIAAAIASLHDTATLMAETQRPVLAQLAAQNDVLVAFAKRHDETERRLADIEASQHALAARQEQDRAAMLAETAAIRQEHRRDMRQMRLICLGVGLTGVLVGYLLG